MSPRFRPVEILETRITPAFTGGTFNLANLASLNGAAGTAFHGAATLDYAGHVVSAAGDVNGDGFDDFIVGALPATGSGEAYVVFGTGDQRAADVTLDASLLNGFGGFKIVGESNYDQAGYSISAAGDVNGDGIGDLIIGARGVNSSAGAAYVVFGKRGSFSATVSLGQLDPAAGFKLTGNATSGTGFSVSAAGDVNGDGIDDVIIGAYQDGGTGAAYIVYGKKGPVPAVRALSALTATQAVKLTGTAANDQAGFSVSGAGDVNGDGFADVVVGARLSDAGGTDSGAAYVVFGSGALDAVIALGSLGGTSGFRVTGGSADDEAGHSVSSAGDLNGDGLADIIVGANGVGTGTGQTSPGAAYIVFGNTAPFAPSFSLDTTAAALRIDGGTRDLAGISVKAAGDVNGDGIDDLIIGAPQTTLPSSTGGAYVVFGRANLLTVPPVPAFLDGTNGFKIVGEETSAQTGLSVSGAGDVNGDGFADLLVGALLSDDGGAGKGQAYLVLGGPSGFFITADVAASGKTATFHDVDGDLVTITTTKGTLFPNAIGLLAHSVASPGAQLTSIVLGSDFEGADLTITAKRGPAGDGKINVGQIFAQGVDLGKVTIGGDLGSIFVGDADDTLALKSLTVGTMGIYGGRTADTGTGIASMIVGGVGPVKIAGDYAAKIQVVDGTVARLTQVASFTVGGSVIGGTHEGSGTMGVSPGNLGKLGPVKIAGDVRGGSGRNTGVLSAASITSVTIGGSVIGGAGSGSAVISGNSVLGKVSIGGSLIGGAGSFSGGVFSQGTLFGVTIKGDQIVGDGFAGGIGSIYGSGDVRSVTIGGDARSTAGTASYGIVTGGGIGSVVIKGDVVGTAAAPYLIAAGASRPGQTLAVASLKVGGDFEHAALLAGNSGFAFTNGHASIGAVTIGGDWIASSVSAGLSASTTAETTDITFGNGDDIFNAGGTVGVVASIKSITIKGSARGTTDDGDRFGIVAETIGSVTIGGVKLPLVKGLGPDPANDLAALHVGPTPDFVVRELSRTVAAPAEPSVSLPVGSTPARSPSLGLGGLASFQGARFSGLLGGDVAGYSVSDGGDINGDGLDDFIIGVPSDGPTARGAAYVVFGKINGLGTPPALSALDGSNGFKLAGAQDSSNTGVSVSAAGDVNGDGFDDLIVGASRLAAGGTARGAAYVVFGRGTFAASIDLGTLDGTTGFRMDGVADGDLAGSAVSGAGDVNGDGFDDLIVGAKYADVSASNAGAAYVVLGRSVFAPSLKLSDLSGTNGFVLRGQAAGDYAGSAVAGVGDVNGDGLADLAVGAYGANGLGSGRGAIYVIYGKKTFAASIGLGSADVSISGAANLDQFGFSLSGAGDVNGDGLADFIAGAKTASGSAATSGAAYVIFGRADGNFPAAAASLDGTNGFKLSGVAATDTAGISVSTAGDTNGDGYTDIIVGAGRADTNGTDSGAAYIVFGKAAGFAGDVALSSLDGNTGIRLSGAAAGERAGFAVSTAGDVNGDGYADLIVGAKGAADQGTNTGAAYLIYGGPTGELIHPTLSADLKTAMWTDVDGDLVTLKITKGTFDTSNFLLLAKSGSDPRARLLALNIAGVPSQLSEFDGADLTLTAKRAGGGDGKVNVGAIFGNNVDLGAIKIGGDLGRLFLGDADDGLGLKSLTVDSLGLFGGLGQDAGGDNTILVTGPAGPVKVAGDVRNALLFSTAASTPGTGQFASITIGGSLVGGPRQSTGALVADTLGPVKIGDDLVGGSYYGTGFLQAGTMGSIKIGGSMLGGGGLLSGAVQSFGKLGDVFVGGSEIGGAGAASASFFITGDAGKFTIQRDQVGHGDASALIFIGGSIRSVTIGGDARAGEAAFAGGILASGTLGAVTVKGDVLGNAEHAYIIRGSGPLTGTKSVAIASVKVGGDLEHAQILAGFGQNNAPTNGHAQIGAITVGGDWIASTVSAGVLPRSGAGYVTGSFGDGDDVFINAGPTGVVASIASITIKGRVGGTLEGGDRYAVVAEQLGALTIGGTKFKLNAGASNDSLDFLTVPDFTIRELSRS